MDKADEAALVKYAQSLEAEIERLRAAFGPIGMQDIRLVAGEGKLSAANVLDATNIILRQRARVLEQITVKED